MVRIALSRSAPATVAVLSLFWVVVPAVLVPSVVQAAGAKSIRAGAALSLSFDDANQPGAVSVKRIAEPFAANLVNAPARVPSPFWNRAGKTALRFDAAKRQSVRLVDIPYTNRPDAVTLSFFFVSLHPATDNQPHGILAKRSAGPRGTNYGINYVPASDVFQLYVNDGAGYRIASYSAKKVLGTRRLAQLTATLEVDEDSATGDDPDLSDVRARLFVNGEPATPKAVVGPGRIHNQDVWFTKVNAAGLLNDAPLTLGCSSPEVEYTSGVLDEFLLFTRALSPSDARQLFLEMAGPRGPELARRELQPVRPLDEPPAIESLSQFGLQIGQTTRLRINGNRLAGKARVDLPIPGVKQSVTKGSDNRHLSVDITVPADAPPGIYPLTVFTTGGVSNPMGIAVDGLPQWLVGDSAEDRPASLPAAFSGLLTGPALSHVYFRGHAGDRLVAEVEARRIGSRLDPVIELKNAAGSTIAIEWGKAFLRGDARAELTLPADGLYMVELHDLAYNAPNESPYRLLLGDFRSVDSYYPPVIPRGADWPVEPVGAGIPPGTLIDANLKGGPAGELAKLLPFPGKLRTSGPLPPLGISDGIEVLEVPQPNQQLQTIDARFAEKQHESVAVNGRLAKEGEIDRYLLAVTPGTLLSFSLDGRSLNSPVEGDVSIYSHPEQKPLGGDGGTPGAAGKGFQFQVPTNVSSIEVAVRDLNGRGGPHFVYRLRIAPTASPDFSLALLDTRVNIPANGRTMVPLQVDRKGYAGPIKLRIEGPKAGAARISIAPQELPAEAQSRKLFVTFTTTGDQTESAAGLRIVGESVGISPAIRRSAVIEVPNQAELSGFLDRVPVGARSRSPLQVDLGTLPRELYKGSVTDWPIVLTADSKKAMGIDADAWVRLSLVSTEVPRPVDPNNPNKRRVKPMIAAMPDQAMPLASSKSSLKVAVPADVAEPAIEFVVKADVVRHPYAAGVFATTYSEPFQVLVKDKPAPEKPTPPKAPEKKPAPPKKKVG